MVAGGRQLPWQPTIAPSLVYNFVFLVLRCRGPCARTGEKHLEVKNSSS